MKVIYPKTKMAAALAVFSATAFFSVPGYTQSPMLEEIIVTAQKRQQSLQDVSVSVNVLNGEKILDAGITKVEDLQAYVPNLTMSETGIGTNIYIRGLGSGINQGFEQSVGMYKDGVSHGRAQLSRAPFLDLERVEVLRGPQNILYGRNSIAGAISLISAKPTDEFEGMFSMTYEPEYGEQVGDIVLSGPLSETFSARLAHRTRRLDGYIENLDGGDEPQRDEQTSRLSLLWEPNDKLSASLIYEHSDFDITGRQIEIIGDSPSSNAAFGGANWSQFLLSLNALNPFTGAAQTSTSVLDTSINFDRSSNGDFSNNSTDSISLTVDYDIGDIQLTSITSSLKYDYSELCDCDFTSADVFFVESDEDYEQFSQEFRLTSAGGQTIDWMAGVYYQSSELDFNDAFVTSPDAVVGNVLDTVLPGLFIGIYPAGSAQQLNNFAAPRTFNQDSDLLSGFLQVTWNISDSTRITAGGRYSNEEKEASRTLDFTDGDGNTLPYDDLFIPNTTMGVDYILGQVLRVVRHDLDGDREESKFAPSFTFEQDVFDDSMAYATWSRGFKSGGYDVRSNAPPQVTTLNPAFPAVVPAGTFEYEEEEAETLEVGLKSRLLDNSLELNMAAFYTSYEDLQVSIFDGTLGFNVGNAAEATSMGVEIDGRWATSENLTLSGSIAWLDFEFDDYPNGQCTQAERIATGEDLCDYAGLSNQYVADFSGFLSADHRIALTESLELNSVLDIIYSSEYNPSQNLDPAVEEDGYTKLNLRFSLSDIDDTWELSVLGKNLTDEEIVTYANDTPLSATLTESIGYYGFLEAPRTIAIQGTFRF